MQTDDLKHSRYILTFSSARTCSEWWSLVQSEFRGPPVNTRESAQLFSFHGDDFPSRVWKHKRFEELKSKWFFTRLGDADGTGGRWQGIIPLQDEKGRVIGPTKRETSPAVRQEVLPSPTTEAEIRWQRRRSKRDSGIMIMSPHLSNFNGHERRDSASNIDAASQNLEPYQKPKFDFERMERNLDKVEKLMEQNAQQMRSLEHVQAANMERLTSALVQNVEMIRELAEGQGKLGVVVEELSSILKEKEKSETRIESGLEGEKKETSRKSKKTTSSSGSTKIASPAASTKSTKPPELITPTPEKIERKQIVRRPPRKVGRTVIGYVYAEDAKVGGNKG
jgi:hypothetical protein